MRTSTNYNLKLPEGTDNVRRKDFVDNFEKIDLELKNNDTSMKDIANDSYPIVEVTGTNTYVGSTTRITSLAKGTKFTLFVGSNASGNCTVNLNNYGAKNVKDSFGNIVNNLKANIPYNLCYNGLDFILQGKGGGGNATADKLLSGSTATVDSGPITGSMPNQGTKTATLNCGGNYIIPAGYHNGNGKVTANSLASQTQGNATTAQILNGFSAWVNGNKINGTAESITIVGGRIINPKGTILMCDVDLGKTPKFVAISYTFTSNNDYLKGLPTGNSGIQHIGFLSPDRNWLVTRAGSTYYFDNSTIKLTSTGFSYTGSTTTVSSESCFGYVAFI